MLSSQAQPALRALTSEQFAAYQKHGFHIERGLMSVPEAAEIREAFMIQSQRGLATGMSTLPPGLTANDPLARYPRMMHPHIHPEFPDCHRLALRWLLDARIEAILHDLLGEQPVAAQSMFYFKPPGARGQDFHQDNFYLQVAPTTCIAAWIAVDAADAENGGLMVASGTHHLPTMCPQQADLTKSMASEHVDIPPGHPVINADLAIGDVLFFNGQVIHGSNPNSSPDRFRRSLICHYLPQSSTHIGTWYHESLRGFRQQPYYFAHSPENSGPCGSGSTLVTGAH